MSFLFLTLLPLLPLTAAQAEIPSRPTVDSMSMIGTGCPVGGAGIGTGAVNGTPIFSFPRWTLDLSSGEETDTEKYCIQKMQLANGPAGYQVTVAALTVGGISELEEGAVLGISVESTLGEEKAGAGSVQVLPSDILSNGTFSATVDISPETWSECVTDDGVVPLISLRTTISLSREEGVEDAKGTVGKVDGEIEDAVTVNFRAIWRECE
ncbi:uncharacterized protein DNG_04235 [Cephalotrichum gorgonifer]|uniref:DUF4360 domain-containing protein n=1 Tax=Cephalotrichum gorgonifer TaxID=2041049 RepID=A0AAE8MWL2_9PEZI|nr:uncharacterized protein DNG_04235 [Cephalotrichum gorgonifer]